MELALLITTLAASTTVLGGVITLFFKKDNQKIVSLFLAFSAGIMLYLSFMEILPKGLTHLQNTNSSLFIGILSFLSGIILIILVDKFISKYSDSHHGNSSIKKIGLLSLILITLHNFPEGMAVYSVAMESINLSWTLVLAIGLHNIPEGIVIAAPLYFATGSKTKTILITTLSALAEPVGGLIGYHFFKYLFVDLTLGIVFCFIAGVMIFLSIDQLLPEARKYGDHHLVGYSTVVGMSFMAISLILLGAK